MLLFASALILPFLLVVHSQPVPNVRDLRARHVPELNIIYVEWQFTQPTRNIVFTVRHKAGSESGPWKYVKTSESNARLPLAGYESGSNVHIQIQAERSGQIIEDWSQEIVITLNGKSAGQSRPISSEKAGLQPPLDFTAHILSPTRVQLEWAPTSGEGTDVYYLVNVKQLTTASGTTLQNQQIKTSATSFTLGKLIAGERYEMTIRSATSQESISNTAAIVEITMPKEDDFFEIGNLIISSHFRTPAQGIVNLTWQVPPTMQNKIISYNVEYAEHGSNYWQKIQFHGASSSAALHHLKSNTEYLLRIKTILINDVTTESGQFKFRTPKVETNPIQKIDVIYSHDVNSVKLQWMLEPHVQIEKVAGYDVYLSEDKDLPDSQWRLVRLNHRNSSLSLDDLKSLTVYFVRVNIRNLDGSVIRAPSIYRFKTIDWTNTSQRAFFNPFD